MTNRNKRIPETTELSGQVAVELYIEDSQLALMHCDFCDLGSPPKDPIIRIRQTHMHPANADSDWTHNTSGLYICTECSQDLIPLLQYMTMHAKLLKP